jgi:hypothetical protein
MEYIHYIHMYICNIYKQTNHTYLYVNISKESSSCRDSNPLTRCDSGAVPWLQVVLVLVVGVEGEIRKIIRKIDGIIAVFASGRAIAGDGISMG